MQSRKATAVCFLLLIWLAPSRGIESIETVNDALAREEAEKRASCANDNLVLAVLGLLFGWGALVTCLLTPPGVTCDAFGCVIGLVLNNVNRNGTIPADIGDLLQLQNLSITNTLYTALPSKFSQLTNLVNLDLSNNKLTSGLSHLISANLSQLTSFKIRNNKFSGNFPLVGGGVLPKLKTLDLSDNQFTGFVDGGAFLVKSTLLETVDLTNNAISTLPTTLITTVSSLTSFTSLLLSGNDLQGLLLELIKLLASLPFNFILNLQYNFFCGLIPPLASRILADPSRLLLNYNCFFDPLPNWCALYASSCSTMRPASQCSFLPTSVCPPVDSGANKTLATLATQVQVSDGPSVAIAPIDPFDGQTYGKVSLVPSTLSEIDAAGNFVGTSNATQTVPAVIQNRYYVDPITSTAGSPGYRLATILDNGAFLFWEVYLDNRTSVKNFVGLDRVIQSEFQNALLEVSYWPPFNPSSVGFEIDFDYNLGPKGLAKNFNSNQTVNASVPLSLEFNGASDGLYSSVIMETGDLVVLNTTLVNLAFGSGNTSYNITHKLSWDAGVNASLVKLQAIMPFTFFPSLFYDPDMGVVFGQGGGSSGGGDGSLSGENGEGDGFKGEYIAAIVVPVVMLGAAGVGITAAVLGYVLYKKLMLVKEAHTLANAATESAVNF